MPWLGEIRGPTPRSRFTAATPVVSPRHPSFASPVAVCAGAVSVLHEQMPHLAARNMTQTVLCKQST
ncbi:hypothetical protein J1614_004563 [Plenodomus biglobosus]|nr:hypothetical protein J1614_004563 [Plenodomus biglobosus]